MGKCSPARKLEGKMEKQNKLLAAAAKVDPQLKSAKVHVANMQLGHEKMHKQDERRKELAARKLSEEKRVKAQGKEMAAKHLERTDKESKHKKYHKHWQSSKAAQEKKNKAQIAFNANEERIVEDTKMRAEAMERAIKKGRVDIEAPPENVHLKIRQKREKQKMDDIDKEIASSAGDKARARKEIDTGSNLGPMGVGEAERV